ncbi:SpoIIE family protein phosphatase [Candidatus Micrarchaeota archaeon]|nr:SpoIIE family protein phosphatase [Candidatus Micrarchaeota archaeon]
MEKLMLGKDIKKEVTFGCKSSLGECFSLVRRGHETCGDSAFIFLDDEKGIFGVFDGVSGEEGAETASSDAAIAALDVLKKYKKADAKAVSKALRTAGRAVTKGCTTAALCFVAKDGSTIVASVGDSPVYGITREKDIVLELPLGRVVKKSNSVLKFFYFRNIVTSVLGPSGSEMHVHTRAGRLKKGEMIMLASDCLNDNLFVKVQEGYVVDATGTDDLKNIVGRLRKPRSILEKISENIKKRIREGRKERKGEVLIPKNDDLALIAFRFK